MPGAADGGSAELIALYMKKAQEALQTAKEIGEKYPDLTISRAYYSIFYAAQSALATKGITGLRRHKGVNEKFNEFFIKTKEFSREIFKTLGQMESSRYDAGYDPKAGFSSEEAKEHVQKAEKFLAAITETIQPKVQELNGRTNETPPEGPRTRLHPARAEAFILDWDGVLADTKLDFKPLRRRYFNGEIVPLVEAASALPEPARSEARSEIRRIEMEGAENAAAVEGAKDLIAWLSAAGKPWAVVSRNCRDSILLAASKCGIALPPVLLSREDPHVKPAPEALALAAERMGVDLAGCVMVGDFVYDMTAANRAGITAVLVRGRGESWENLADFSYATVRDLVEALRSSS